MYVCVQMMQLTLLCIHESLHTYDLTYFQKKSSVISGSFAESNLRVTKDATHTALYA